MPIRRFQRRRKPYNRRRRIRNVHQATPGQSKSLRYASRIGGVIKGFGQSSPFPPLYHCKLKYSGVHTMTAGASGVIGTTQKYCINSLYDPDQTGVGHQVYGFDSLATLYNRYKVTGVLIDVEINDPTASGISVCYQMLNPSNNSATIAALSPYQVQEKSMGGSFTMNDTGSQKGKRKWYVDLAKASGLTKLQFMADPDNFTGPVTGDPGSKIEFELGVADLRGAATPSVMYEIRLTFYAQFYQRKILATS